MSADSEIGIIVTNLDTKIKVILCNILSDKAVAEKTRKGHTPTEEKK